MGCRSLHVSRSRFDSVKASRLSFRGERYSRLTFSPHQSRSRYRLRYRGQRHGPPRQHDRRHKSGGGTRENENQNGLKISHLALLLSVLVVLIWSAVEPHDRLTWWLEVFPALAALVILFATYRRFEF